MSKLEFSPLVKTKMKMLKQWLTEHYGEKKARKVLTEMVRWFM